MPLPRRDRLGEYARKGVEVVLRSGGHAPEQRAARKLAALVDEQAPAPAADARRVMILSPRSWAYHTQVEAVLAHALRLRGADVAVVTCGGGLDICDRANVSEAPPMPCRSCRGYTERSLAAHDLDVTRLADGWTADDPGPWPELDELGLDELAELHLDGLPLGEAVDVPAKWFLLQSRLDHDPLGPSTVRQFLTSARRVAGCHLVGPHVVTLKPRRTTRRDHNSARSCQSGSVGRSTRPRSR